MKNHNMDIPADRAVSPKAPSLGVSAGINHRGTLGKCFMNNSPMLIQDQIKIKELSETKTCPVSNFYLDALMSRLSPSALSILLYVVERTRGEGFDRAAISFSQFQKLCNLSCDSVTNGIKELEDLSVIKVIRSGPGRGKVSIFSLLCDPQARSTEVPLWYFKTFPELRFSMKLVLLAIIRKIIGWDKTEDRISFSQFQKLTGLSLKYITFAIRELEKSGLIYVHRPGIGKINTFSFVPLDYETALVFKVPQKLEYPKNRSTPKRKEVENLNTPNRNGVETLITPKRIYTRTRILILLSFVFNSYMCFTKKSFPLLTRFTSLAAREGKPPHTRIMKKEREEKRAENIFGLVGRAVDSSGVFIVKRAWRGVMVV